jgi:hypothetical protein
MKITSIPFTKHQPLDPRLPPVYLTYSTLREIWILVDDYRITVPLPTEGSVSLQIPAGFEFDLASVPRIVWPLISSFELSLVAPLIHDYFYEFTGSPVYHEKVPALDFRSHYHRVTRYEADQIFLQMMLREGVKRWKARSSYAAVRAFATRW